MRLENQVCSLELAKKFKELGIKQESDFYWCQLASNVIKVFCSLCREHRDFGSYNKLYSAFTVAELGEMLPEAFFWENMTQVGLHCGKYSGGWHVYYKTASKRIHYEDDKTEADARAKMLVYLIEKKLTDINKSASIV